MEIECKIDSDALFVTKWFRAVIIYIYIKIKERMFDKSKTCKRRSKNIFRKNVDLR